MTLKTELDEVERLSYEGALSRDRDPVVPRGEVVAGEPSGLEVRGYEAVDGGGRTVGVYRTQHEALMAGTTFCVHKLTRRSDAQERIRALEEREAELAKVLGAVIYAATLCPGEHMVDPPEHAAVRAILNAVAERDRLAERVAQNVMALSERDARLEECRGVVRAAVWYQEEEERGDGHSDACNHNLRRETNALTPATRAWAEGEEGAPIPCK